MQTLAMILNLAENKFKCGLWAGIIIAQEFIKYLVQVMVFKDFPVGSFK